MKLHGYYGGLRLIKAIIKRFSDYCRQNDIRLGDGNFTIEFHTDIPRLVGLAGSSAIITATLRALMQHYRVAIHKHIMPNIILAAEKEELNIQAGMQDRVIQTYEGIVYMDFDRALMESRGYGIYEELHPEKLPPLYVAYDPDRAEVSDIPHRNLRDIPHRNLRDLFNRGDETVVNAMKTYRDLTDRARDALMSADWGALGKVMDENFDLRQKIMPIAPENLRMVEVARSTGASAKFAGSGGAIIGLYKDGRQYQDLVDALGELRCQVLRPLIYAA